MLPWLHLLVSNSPCGVESRGSLGVSEGVLVVSNSPCGVERRYTKKIAPTRATVSNSPCGVESLIRALFLSKVYMFLIHRVELKACLLWLNHDKVKVSNSPCGVESCFKK